MTVASTLLTLLAPLAAAEEQSCENGLVGWVLPYEAGAQTPTGTSADAEVVRCWTTYEDPFYVHFHRSVNATVTDASTGAYARAHLSEQAGGVNNEDNGTNWSYYAYTVDVDAGSGQGDLPTLDLLVVQRGTSVNEDDASEYEVRGRVAYGDVDEEVGGTYADPYEQLYEGTIEPLPLTP